MRLIAGTGKACKKKETPEGVLSEESEKSRW